MMIDRNGMRSLRTMAAGALPNDPNALNDALARGVDWDAALQDGNLWYDRMAAALREKDPGLRKSKLEKIDDDLHAYMKARKLQLANPKGQLEIVSGGPRAVGRVIGDILIGLLLPAVHKVQNAFDRIKQTHDNLHVAFALAKYHCENGHYPKNLDALAPKYLDRLPQDIFSGKPLIYRPTENGYLLYSVGPNGKDDGGRGYDDEPSGDDLVIRMPLPELKQK
jgi:hypothetical protein